MALSERTGRLNEPYFEWELRYEDPPHDPYDVVAFATFTHEATGERRRSTMFYAGDGAWKFRFT